MLDGLQTLIVLYKYLPLREMVWLYKQDKM